MSEFLLFKHRVKFLLQLLADSKQRKHVGHWLVSLRDNYLLEAGMPWLTFDATAYLRQQLPNGLKVFEYGSGGSTLFWLKFNAAQIVSVEHDPEWFSLLNQYVNSIKVVDYRLAPPEKGNQDNLWDEADPACYCSQDSGFHGYSFKNYVSQIDSFPSGYFDVVLIDGRARPSCIAHSVDKVKIGGWLILDNADRSYYTLNTHPYLSNFQCREFWGAGPVNGYLWQTNIYQKLISGESYPRS